MVKNQSDLIRFDPRQLSKWIRTNSKPIFQSESIWARNDSDEFWLKIRFGSIRARIDSDWKLGFGLVRIHSDSCLGLNRIKWDRFFTIFHQTNYKTFFGLVTNDSHWLGYRYRNEPEYFWLAPNEFLSDTFARVYSHAGLT